MLSLQAYQLIRLFTGKKVFSFDALLISWTDDLLLFFLVDFRYESIVVEKCFILILFDIFVKPNTIFHHFYSNFYLPPY